MPGEHGVDGIQQIRIQTRFNNVRDTACSKSSAEKFLFFMDSQEYDLRLVPELEQSVRHPIPLSLPIEISRMTTSGFDAS